MSTITQPANNRYQDFLRDIKTQVAQSWRAVNRSLIGLSGCCKMIVERDADPTADPNVRWKRRQQFNLFNKGVILDRQSHQTFFNQTRRIIFCP